MGLVCSPSNPALGGSLGKTGLLFCFVEVPETRIFIVVVVRKTSFIFVIENDT